MKYICASLSDLRSRLIMVGLEKSSLVREAINQAEDSLGNTLRDEGTPYIESHVYPVAISLMDCPELRGRVTEELIASAILHDVLEDDPTLERERFREKFGDKIYTIVDFLTKPKMERSSKKEEDELTELRDEIYFERLGRAPVEAKYIKLADRLNNLSSVHLSKNRKKIQRYMSETRDFYLPFAERLSSYYFKQISQKFNELEKLVCC